MATKQSQRAAADKWDAANMAYQTVKVRRDLLDSFKAACAERGDKVNTVLREAMENYVNGTNDRPVAGLTNDETLHVIGQLAADIEELRAIYLCETVDDETRNRAAINAEHVLDLIQKITAALPDGSEQRKNSE